MLGHSDRHICEHMSGHATSTGRCKLTIQSRGPMRYWHTLRTDCRRGIFAWMSRYRQPRPEMYRWDRQWCLLARIPLQRVDQCKSYLLDCSMRTCWGRRCCCRCWFDMDHVPEGGQSCWSYPASRGEALGEYCDCQKWQLTPPLNHRTSGSFTGSFRDSKNQKNRLLFVVMSA